MTTSNLMKIYQVIKENRANTPEDLRDLIGISQRTVQRNLRKLLERNWIEKEIDFSDFRKTKYKRKE